MKDGWVYKVLNQYMLTKSILANVAIRPRFGTLGFAVMLLFTGMVQAGGPVIVEGMTLQDPTRPANWQPPRAERAKLEKPAVTLDSIIYSQQRRLVVLNGQSLSEGQQRKGVKVIKIESRRVLLEWQGARWYASVTPATNGSISIRRTQ